MEYISVREAAEKWGISERRVRALCESNKIEGVKKCGMWVWSIPSTTVKPADGRTLRYIKNRNLRPGNINLNEINFLKSIAYRNNSSIFSSNITTKIICDILTYNSLSITEKQIQNVINLEKEEFDLKTHIQILNIFNCLSHLPTDVNETSLKKFNNNVVLNLSQNGGEFALSLNQAQETEALLEQYYGPWSVLHPIVRGAFLFCELLRISPFKEANNELAFLFLENELIKASYPPVSFGTEKINQLKASLASVQLRGNTKPIIDLIVSSLKEQNENAN